jgi:choline kinase
LTKSLPVLLAAGLGSRLGGGPKCLLRVSGRALLDYCVLTLAQEGFDRLLVVTGHGADLVRGHVAASDYPLDVSFLHNELYAQFNNFYTVLIACEIAEPGRLLVLNSDIVFAPSVIAAATQSDASLALCVEPSTPDEEALKVEVLDGRVIHLGKGVPSHSAFGEFVGVSAMDDVVRALYVSLARSAAEAGDADLYYEDVYDRLCHRVEVRACRVDAGTWAEIDRPADVPGAAAVIEATRRATSRKAQ